jgi:hypothetical protein
MTGRPTKLTPQLADFIVNLIEGGVPRRRAAEAAGIAASTLFDWLSRGDNEHPINPDHHRKAELQRIAREREIEIPRSATKEQIAAAINDAPTPFSDFSDRVRAADSRFFASAIGKMRETGGDDWRMWDRLLERRFPELRIGRAGEDALADLDHLVGSDADAERALERSETIRIKMLGTGDPPTGTDG